MNVREQDGTIVRKIIDTTVGRVMFNQFVPAKVGYINALLTKKSLREIIGDIVKITDVPSAAKFLMILRHLASVWPLKEDCPT